MTVAEILPPGDADFAELDDLFDTFARRVQAVHEVVAEINDAIDRVQASLVERGITPDAAFAMIEARYTGKLAGLTPAEIESAVPALRESMSQRAVAAITGMTVSAVKMREHRERKRSPGSQSDPEDQLAPSETDKLTEAQKFSQVLAVKLLEYSGSSRENLAQMIMVTLAEHGMLTIIEKRYAWPGLSQARLSQVIEATREYRTTHARTSAPS